jgi:hypothetical protein
MSASNPPRHVGKQSPRHVSQQSPRHSAILRACGLQVCLHFARKLMAQRSWQLAELMAAWGEAVPAPFAPSRQMLLGEAIPAGAVSLDKGAGGMGWGGVAARPLRPRRAHVGKPS